MQTPLRYGQIGCEIQNLPKKAMFRSAPSVLQLAVTTSNNNATCQLLWSAAQLYSAETKMKSIAASITRKIRITNINNPKVVVYLLRDIGTRISLPCDGNNLAAQKISRFLPEQH